PYSGQIWAYAQTDATEREVLAALRDPPAPRRRAPSTPRCPSLRRTGWMVRTVASTSSPSGD
ncbi:hypothetical protein, partial [Streptomyces sp. NPDC051173]|uniref:hypothetical protein n=1 Tax=Streptomyces sp. NPDC051173 TaxID=3155164 RepID=UPI00344CBC71